MGAPLMTHVAPSSSRKRSRGGEMEIEAIKRLRIAAPALAAPVLVQPPPFPAQWPSGDVDYAATNALLNRLHHERLQRHPPGHQ